MLRRRRRRARRITVNGHTSAYPTQSRRPWLREIRRIGTTWTCTPAASKSPRSGGSAGTTTWHSNSGRQREKGLHAGGLYGDTGGRDGGEHDMASKFWAWQPADHP